ncbi:MAG: hybrid sensor histidine kinase/response regulator, partial [Syntrophomonadaceae bacterium]|nr:hybrid sensor histidine kinase/response regulator [Syntrophomonadaceae bacterium]
IFSGISSYKALGKNLYKILPDIRGTKADQVFLEVMKTRKSQTFIHEYQYKKKNYIFEVSVYPAENGISIFARDITRYKLMEKEIARLDRLDLAGKIAASISHEIRNPLTTVKGFLQILRNQDKYEQEKEFFDLMIEELERSNLIISEFLRLAKNKSIELSEQNLNTIIQNLYPLMDANARISDKQILLELEDIPDLLLDKKEICQLIVNLVRNGLEAMSPGQNLTIKTFLDKKAEEVVLAIRDEGCGIDPEILDKIGTPFLTTKEEGTGLGLPVCYSIAARHNADIKIETGQNGTTFFIRFKNPIMTLF